MSSMIFSTFYFGINGPLGSMFVLAVAAPYISDILQHCHPAFSVILYDPNVVSSGSAPNFCLTWKSLVLGCIIHQQNLGEVDSTG
ncbi:hypothetical protein BT96DRAFT_69341 [Gymnopus androsaceus JB14]|uniref:Uncharacterized protein n=1 Tax=Gymnopus androsaceus JB14 TaxID=1447944 RepID=A0A6A4HIS3_9AGAR|nr:hypothetical protein BT96DRAFT_69341 [Gymnopus androsaceus JB14]